MTSTSDTRAAAWLPTLMLVLVTVLWGLSFPLMKSWQTAAGNCPGGGGLSSFTLMALRYILAFFIIVLVHPKLLFNPKPADNKVGLALGAGYATGSALQVLGLLWATPALSAFITSLCCAWVPFLAAWWFKAPLRPLTLIGALVGVSGTAVLSNAWGAGGLHLGWGEGLTVISTGLFAVQVLILDRWGRHCEPLRLTAAIAAVSGFPALGIAAMWAFLGPGFGPWLWWICDMLRDPAMLLAIILLAVFSTVLAFHWMNVYQPRLPAARAALIYLLEPIFGSGFSILWGQDVMSGNLLWGGCLILLGNVLVELPALTKIFKI